MNGLLFASAGKEAASVNKGGQNHWLLWKWCETAIWPIFTIQNGVMYFLFFLRAPFTINAYVHKYLYLQYHTNVKLKHLVCACGPTASVGFPLLGIIFWTIPRLFQGNANMFQVLATEGRHQCIYLSCGWWLVTISLCCSISLLGNHLTLLLVCLQLVWQTSAPTARRCSTTTGSRACKACCAMRWRRPWRSWTSPGTGSVPGTCLNTWLCDPFNF